MLFTILHIISFIFFVYLFISVTYILVFAIAGNFQKTTIANHNNAPLKKIAVLIPSYKEDNIIVDTAIHASQHDYENFEVIVIADKLQAATIEQLQKIKRVKVCKVSFEISTKAKSLNNALNSIKNDLFDIVMVLDADNVMQKGCLQKVNNCFAEGYQVVQCHRTAKNENTPVALLDAISEEINNNIFRKGHSVLGLPSSIIGSGVAYTFSLLHEIFSLPEILDNPGEDREIDVQLVKRGITVAFLNGAYVYDEKVANTQVFEKQRVRWLEAQVHHVKRFLSADVKSKRFTSVFIHKLWQCFLLPRLLYIALFFFIGVVLIIQYFTSYLILWPPPLYWMLTIFIYVAVLLISIPRRYFSAKTLKALFQIPALVFSMVKSILQIKSGRKEFIHTPKTFTHNK
jgi:cellulose synthase/poly-beta-1,6-N-acetylglucosamine synthase-like glycosyltransferase